MEIGDPHRWLVTKELLPTYRPGLILVFASLDALPRLLNLPLSCPRQRRFLAVMASKLH